MEVFPGTLINEKAKHIYDDKNISISFFWLTKGAKIYPTLLALLFFGKFNQIIESNESSPSASVPTEKA